MHDFTGRLRRTMEQMERRGVDTLMVSVGADLPYLTGYEAMPSERLTMFVLTRDHAPTLVIPALEAPRVEAGHFEVIAWKESEDVLSIVAGLANRPTVAAIGDRTWAVFLLGLLPLMPATTFVPASAVTKPLRMVKDGAEVEALRKAAEAVDRVASRIPSEVRFGGRPERDVARDIVEMTLAEGHDTASFWIVAAGPNGASPHHEPGERIIEAGDAVVVDFGGRMDGYCSDTTRTFVVGSPSAELIEVHGIVAAAQSEARSYARAGVTAESVDQVARAVIADAGYGEFFVHRLGHGIGLEGHEHPYLVEGDHHVLEPGNAFSIEPGIYLPGKFGVRIEDIAVIAPDGSLDVLNQSDRALVEVD
jgi:Xaa-Pro aminopeptidase